MAPASSRRHQPPSPPTAGRLLLGALAAVGGSGALVVGAHATTDISQCLGVTCGVWSIGAGMALWMKSGPRPDWDKRPSVGV